MHRGYFKVGRIARGNSDNLTPAQKDTIDRVLGYYGDKSPQWLSDLTLMEDPWRSARRGVPDGMRGNRVIPKQDLAEYYGSLT